MLKKNVRLRRIGIYTTLLATGVQGVTLWLAPPTHTTAHDSNLIYGGVTSAYELLQKYQKNEASLQETLTAIGLSLADLQSLSLKQHFTHDQPYTYRVSRTPFPSQQPAHKTITHPNGDTIFLSPIDPRLATEPALIGNSPTLGTFAILTQSGDIVVEKIPKNATSLLPNGVTLQVYVENNTSNRNTTANAGDHLTYKIVVKNTTQAPATITPTIYTHDLLPYADIINTDKGSIDDKKTMVKWTPVTLAPNQSIELFFTTRIKPHINANPYNPGNPYIHDCIISPHASSTPIHLHCPLQKNIELILTHLPHTSQAVTTTSIALTLLLGIALYIREKQYQEELRLVRHTINKGTLL